MQKAVLWLQTVLIPTLGPAGLVVIAIFDSSFLSLPEVNDILVVTSAAARPSTAWMYVLAATTGSVLGCSILWTIGRRGGVPLLVRKFGEEKVARTRRAFHKWDLLALALPAMLPPPMPFKIFVLSSGVFGVPFPRFACTIVIARGVRYTFWGAMGAIYGPRAVAVLHEFDAWFAANALPVLAAVALGALVAVVVVYARRRRGTPPPAEPEQAR